MMGEADMDWLIWGTDGTLYEAKKIGRNLELLNEPGEVG